jgi:hypothetical protein
MEKWKNEMKLKCKPKYILELVYIIFENNTSDKNDAISPIANFRFTFTGIHKKKKNLESGKNI